MSEQQSYPGPGETELRALRESRGITLDALYNTTKIRVAILEAIESGNFQLLPERIYGESFIKSYAREVGAEPGPIIARYRRFLGIPEPGEVPEKKPDRKPEKKTENKAEKKPDQPIAAEKPGPEEREAATREAKVPETFASAGSARAGERRKFSRKAVSLVLTVLVLSGGFLYFLFYDESPEPVPVIKPETPLAVSPAPVPAGTEQPQPQGASPPAVPATPAAPETEKAPTSTANKLSIRASELTWVSIVEDDNQPYQIMLRPGDSIERVARRFIIDIGNAGGVSLNLNGSDLGVPGRRGQVVHLILPRENTGEPAREAPQPRRE